MQERGCRYQWSLDPAAAAHIHTEYVPSSLSTLALPPLSTRSYLSPPSPDFDPANTLPPAFSTFPDRKFSTFVVSPFIFNISPRNFSSFLK